MTGRSLFLVFLLVGSSAAQFESATSDTFVSASDLAIPARARKEFDKANKFIAQRDFAAAEDHLRKAIALYPNYASAYNSLGVVYARRGDHAREREALGKAVSIDDHFALAYLNLGRMGIADGDFQSAEAALRQASSFGSGDPITLVLLSYAELMDRHFDEAIATSRQVHALKKPHAFAHRLAANAFEQKADPAGAIEEMEMFLAEEPTGPQADAVRKDLELLQEVTRTSRASRSNTASAAPGPSKGAIPSSDR